LQKVLAHFDVIIHFSVVQQENQCRKCGGTGVRIDAEQLRFRRLRKGIPLELAAQSMNITPSYLCDLEHERRDWNADLLARFEKALKI
jgi:hypothetical protein